ncbi:IS110 family transposase, partial [Legionella bozemanae]
DKQRKTIIKKKINRANLMDIIRNINPCKIAMEACAGSNYWGRIFRSMGHEVMLISPQHVKPFVRGNKNDANDAQGIVTAAMQDGMPSVPIKSLEQQDIQLIHRRREELVRRRTALTNQARGFLTEYGIVMRQGMTFFTKEIPEILENAGNELTQIAREEIYEIYQEVLHLIRLISQYDKKLENICLRNENCKRLMKLKGIGPLTASLLVVKIGDAKNFKNGRHFAAFVGLVPKEHSSGGKQCLMGISKRGDITLRNLLINGGRSVAKISDKKITPLNSWVNRIKQDRGFNKACVAIANKNARHAWAIMYYGEEYKYQLAS